MIGYMPRVYDASDRRIVKRGYTPKVNKYAGTCGCGKHVPAGQGAIAKRYGKWVVYCKDHSATALY